jgi:hypothetical protein
MGDSTKPTEIKSAEPASGEADQALFTGQVQGIVAALRSDQRPLQGLVGKLDWRFQGAISTFIREGNLRGEAGECVYLPLTRANRVYHVILVGAGPAADPELPPASLQALKKNISSLKLASVGVSRSDLGKSATSIQGASICLVR